MDFSKKNIAVFLIILGAISLAMRIWLTDFSIPVHNDDFSYVLRAIANKNGYFLPSPNQTPGWPMFLSLFMHFTDSGNFIEYSNIARLVSMSLSTLTILPVYLIGRKFFNVKYALVLVVLFAFEPHLIRWSTFGFTEPIYILIMLGSLYFLLRERNDKLIYLSFLLVGLLWQVRLTGIIMIVAISVIYFINFRKSSNLIKKYVLCLFIFILISTPVLLQRYDEYGDPLYYHVTQNIFTQDQDPDLASNAENLKGQDRTAIHYIQTKGLGAFIYNFVIIGIFNIFIIMSKLSFPYLIFFAPFAILFSLRAFDQNKKYIQANWIFILFIAGFQVMALAIYPEKRLLFPLLPFIMIFSVIPIQRLIEYGLSTFSFSDKQKRNFLLVIIILILISSIAFSTRYLQDSDLEREKLDFNRTAESKLEGNLIEGGYVLSYLTNVRVEPPGSFNNFVFHHEKEPYRGFPYETGNIKNISIYGKSLEELISIGQEYNLKYLSIHEDGSSSYPFLDDVYHNEENYPYLIKVLDTKELGYKKFHAKIFEIDYEKFDQFRLTNEVN